jgi:hypothetical protein
MPSLDRVASRQHGLVTRAQLHEAGLSARQVERAIARRALLPVRKGVHRLAGSRPTWEQCLHAAVLAAPEGAAASHFAAARLWGLRGLTTDCLELAAPGRVRLAGVFVHDRIRLPKRDVSKRQGIPVTTVARTLCDLASVVDPRVLGRALDEAVRSGQVTLAEVAACLARRGSAYKVQPIRRLLADRAVGPALGESPLETKILRWLREGGLPDPKVQHRVRLAGRERRFDAAYPELHIAMEFHGWGEHGKRSAFEPDLTRRNEIEVAGWLLLEFADRHSKDEVIATVTAARAAQERRLELTRSA